MGLYRMIAIDLDGTLLDPKGNVTPATKAAVHRALAAGLLICFATGRNWTESRAVLESVAHYDSAVFVSGAMVIDTKQQVTLHKTAMDPTLAAELCKTLEDMGHAALALQDAGEAGTDYLITANAPVNNATSQWMKATASTVHEIPSLGNYPHQHTIRVGIVAEPPEIARVKAAINDRFGGRALCQSLYVPAYTVEVLEIFDPAVNKWEGILHVARRHDILPHQIVAVGDDVNDLPMIQNAGLGVAMGNARPEVLAAAKRVIKPNTQDGLAQFLDELVAAHIVEPLEPGEIA